MTFKENAKTALAKVLSDLIQSDGIVNQGEIQYLYQVFKVLNINDSNLKKSGKMTLSEAVAVLKRCGSSEKAAILHAIQQLSVSDDNLDENESLLITTLVVSIGIATPQTNDIEAELVSVPYFAIDTRNTVLYVEPSYHRKVNTAIQREHEAICRLLETKGKTLTYLPKVMEEIKRKKGTFMQMLSYLDPLLSKEQMHIIEHDLKRFDSVALSKEIFINHLNSKGFNLDRPAFLFKIDNQCSKDCQDLLILKIGESPLRTLEAFYKLNSQISHIHPTGINKKDQCCLNQLTMPQSKGVKDEFQYTGIHKTIVDTILKYHGNQGFSRIRISEDGHLYLIDRNDAEVKIQALGRALYILFLRHEEGIALAELSDHRDELMDIYASISNYNDTARLQKTVDNLVDFVGSTINPLISRIRKAFVTLLGEQAKDYLIEGYAGEMKKINLSRDLVIDDLH